MVDHGLTEDTFDEDFDVLIAGSGAAACSAAVAASISGARTAVFERADALGGTTALSGAGAWIPNNSMMRANGLDDPREKALLFMASMSYPHLFDPTNTTLGLPIDAYELLETYYDKGSEAIDWLVAHDAAEFYSDVSGPDYHVEHPHNVAPYGRLVRPVESTPQAMAAGHRAGPALIDRMMSLAQRNGAQVRTNHRVMSVIRNSKGECVGAEVRYGRTTILARARKGIIFGTGGFLHDERLRREFLMGPTYGGCATPGSQGDFVRIGGEVGAQLANMKHAWWYQIALEHVLDSSQTAGGLFMPFGDSMIQVNRYGQRVTNEKGPYNERGPVHFAWDGREYRNLVLFEIYDDHVANDPNPIGVRFPTPMPGESVKYVISGNTLEDLVANISIRLKELQGHTGGIQLHSEFLSNLRSTIDRFDGFARRGIDEDFGRGSFELRPTWVGIPRPDTKATMHPFDSKGPYHCILLVAGALDTKGGPKINTLSQVLDVYDKPIPGLYGAGNCIASPAGQGYWGPGVTIGSALTFGWIAGMNAAIEPSKDLD
ncbi:MAG TPA: FAD-dependent oxidoreductase [Acidimicrobiales bacterium]